MFERSTRRTKKLEAIFFDLFKFLIIQNYKKMSTAKPATAQESVSTISATESGSYTSMSSSDTSGVTSLGEGSKRRTYTRVPTSAERKQYPKRERRVAKPVTVATAPKPTKKKAVVANRSQRASAHPTYMVMIQKAIAATKKGPKGASRRVIQNYLLKTWHLGSNDKIINFHIRSALVRGLETGAFVLTKGTGLNGFFRLGGVRFSGDRKVGRTASTGSIQTKKTGGYKPAAGKGRKTKGILKKTVSAPTAVSQRVRKPGTPPRRPALKERMPTPGPRGPVKRNTGSKGKGARKGQGKAKPTRRSARK